MVLCLPDSTMAISEVHVSFVPLQLSSNSRLIRVKHRAVCLLWPLCQNILMQHEPAKCTLFRLILQFSFSIFDTFYMFQTSPILSQDGLKHVENIKIEKLNESV
jgi:hypothetical protein